MTLRTMPEDLTAEQIEDILQRWHNSSIDDSLERERLQNRLHRAITESQAIQELAKTPLLVLVLARFNYYRELPQYKRRLYSDCASFLLQYLDFNNFLVAEDRHIAIDSDDKKEILELIAAEMQANVSALGGNIIGEFRLQGVIKSYLSRLGVAKAHQTAGLITGQIRIQDNVLIYLGNGFYSFVHQRFLEYFHAAFFIRKFHKKHTIDREFLKTHVFGPNGKDSWYKEMEWPEGAIYSAVPDIFKADVFGKYCTEDWWHGVLALMAGEIHEPFAGEMIECLILQDGESQQFENLFVAAKCLAEVVFRNVIGDVDRQLCDRLKELAMSEVQPKQIRKRAIDALETTWEDDDEVLLWVATNRRSIRQLPRTE